MPNGMADSQERYACSIILAGFAGVCKAEALPYDYMLNPKSQTPNSKRIQDYKYCIQRIIWIWIPAFAGMTEGGAGMTKEGAEMKQ